MPADELAGHLTRICERENINAEAEAVTAIARAAEGSVRDALSLLDQAAAMTADKLSPDSIADMLGRPGRQDSITILGAALKGDAAGALAALASAMANGAEPEMVIADLLDLVHRASLKAAGAASRRFSRLRRHLCPELAELGIARLGRAWQMLLKGHGEVTSAPQPGAAAEMLVIRLAHLANMPTPGEIVRKLADPARPRHSKRRRPHQMLRRQTRRQLHGRPATSNDGGRAWRADCARSATAGDSAAGCNARCRAGSARGAQPTTLLDVSELADAHDEPLLAALIRTHVRLVRMQPGLLEINLTDGAPETLPGDMARQLTRWTDTRWMVSLSDGAGGRTISEERQAARQKQRDDLAETPVIKSIFETFPGAEIESVRPAGQQDEEPSQ